MGFFSKDRNMSDKDSSATRMAAIENIKSTEADLHGDKLSSQPLFNSPKLKSNYGIDDAIKLLRKLTHINSDVKIIVAKTTLESMNVVIGDLIKEAQGKEENITNQIAQLRKEIDALQAEIKKRNDSIAELQADFTETKEVRLCLTKGEPLESNQKTQNKTGLEAAPNLQAEPSVKNPATPAEKTEEKLDINLEKPNH